MDLNKFKELLSVPSKTYQEEDMVEYLCDELEGIEGVSFYRDEMMNIYATKGTLEEGEFYPMFIAHTDTVHSKIEYEGNLDRLFTEDINKFIEYNIRDVEILIELEKRFKFIELTIAICHLCHVPYEQIYLSTALNDGAILTYLKRQGIVSPNKPTTTRPALYDIKEEYAGGYLKDPVPGLYEWVIDLDFTSLYPSIIRSLNIGIETYVGRIVNNDKYDNQWTLGDLKRMNPEQLITIERLKDDKTTNQSQATVGQIIKFIEDGDILVAASGAMFRTDRSSVVCEVLTDWFNKRVEYKNLMKKAYKSGDAPKTAEAGSSASSYSSVPNQF